VIDLREVVGYGEWWRLLAPWDVTPCGLVHKHNVCERCPAFEDGGNRAPTKHWYTHTKLHVVTNHRAIVFKFPSRFSNIYNT